MSTAPWSSGQDVALSRQRRRDSTPEYRTARFWSKVDKSGGPSACWPWLGPKDKHGYGLFYFGDRGKRGAHRFAFQLAGGEFPPGTEAAHSCHRRECCNPAHLRAATHKDNVQDRQLAGRQAKGERNGRAKLTAADVALFRERYRRGEKCSALAHAAGIDPSSMRDLLKGVNWKHVQRIPLPGEVVFSRVLMRDVP